jgi:hypothetical protein
MTPRSNFGPLPPPELPSSWPDVIESGAVSGSSPFVASLESVPEIEIDPMLV